MRPLGSQKFVITLDKQTVNMLRQYATASRRTMTKVASSIVADWLAARAEIGDGLPGGADVKLKRAPILHELLAGMEQRITATINTQDVLLHELGQRGERLTIMLEHLLRRKD